jgi:hypothetical protein
MFHLIYKLNIFGSKAARDKMRGGPGGFGGPGGPGGDGPRGGMGGGPGGFGGGRPM